MGKRDPQQQKVYRWEAEWKTWNVSTATLPELRQVIAWCLRRYGVKAMPAVKQHLTGQYAFSVTHPDGCRGEISFQKSTSKNAATAIHEAAHQICDVIFGETVQHHGQEWLGIHMALMEDAKVIPVEALHATALKHKLKWRPRSELGPEILKRKK